MESIYNHLNEHILDSITEGVFTIDKYFKVQYFNRAAEKITGFSRSEIGNKVCKTVCSAEKCASECPISTVMKTNRDLHDYETNVNCKSGGTVPVKMNASILRNGDGEPIGGVVSFRDVSDLERIRKELQGETGFCGIVGRSKPMHDIFDLIREVADSPAAVFIQGESGTGKELIADAIQKSSARKDKPYVKISCSVFPPNLLASELFGHVKGAFTDAKKDRIGRFEAANGGTVFLDEIAEIPLQMQIQLLRVLQEGTFERIGESRTRKTDVRIIAATNIDIHKAIENGSFREDLFYRLNVIPVEVPPLRRRPADISLLVDHFVKKCALIYKRDVKELDDAVMDALLSYRWPGNIRELENVIEYMFVRSGSDSIIMPSKLPPHMKTASAPQAASAQPKRSPRASGEREMLILALEKHRWNKSAASKELGIGRTTLWRKMKQHGLAE